MEMNQLEKSILYLLRNKQYAWWPQESLETKKIFEKYNNISQKHIQNSLKTLKDNGFIKVSPDKHSVTITQEGLAKIKN